MNEWSIGPPFLLPIEVPFWTGSYDVLLGKFNACLEFHEGYVLLCWCLLRLIFNSVNCYGIFVYF